MSEPTFRIPISNGILTREHYERMGDGIWYFMWCVDKTTKEQADEDGNTYGIVLGGMPIHDQDIADNFGVHRNTAREWRLQLTRESYIKTKRTPNGYSIKVLKSKKWPKRVTENCESQKTVNHDSGPSDAQVFVTDAQNFVSDAQEPVNAIRQDKDSTRTKQRESKAPPALTPSLSDACQFVELMVKTARIVSPKAKFSQKSKDALREIIERRKPDPARLEAFTKSEVSGMDDWDLKNAGSNLAAVLEGALAAQDQLKADAECQEVSEQASIAAGHAEFLEREKAELEIIAENEAAAQRVKADPSLLFGAAVSE
jgi:hypothetical protein